MRFLNIKNVLFNSLFLNFPQNISFCGLRCSSSLSLNIELELSNLQSSTSLSYMWPNGVSYTTPDRSDYNSHQHCLVWVKYLVTRPVWLNLVISQLVFYWFANKDYLFVKWLLSMICICICVCSVFSLFSLVRPKHFTNTRLVTISYSFIIRKVWWPKYFPHTRLVRCSTTRLHPMDIRALSKDQTHHSQRKHSIDLEKPDGFLL